MKDLIALHLKKMRNDLGYSTEYVANSLKQMGFKLSPNTLYNYENGVSQPKADMFLCLCKIYGITSFDIFFNDEKNTLLEDQKILEAYRAHPEMQAAVNKMLDITESTETSTQNPSISADMIDDITKLTNMPTRTNSK